MGTREAMAKALQDLPSGLVRWASAPRESLPRRTTGVTALDVLLGGGWPRGRMAVLRAAAPGAAGRTALATAAVAATTIEGRTAAWIDGDASLDPASLAAAGADLSRILWVRGPLSLESTLSAAEEVLAAGDFAVTVVRPPEGSARAGATAGWVRLARGAERARVVLLVLDRGGTAAAAGGVLLHVGTLRGRWAGSPGPGSLLVGADIPVQADEGATDLRLSVAEALDGGDPLPVPPRAGGSVRPRPATTVAHRPSLDAPEAASAPARVPCSNPSPSPARSGRTERPGWARVREAGCALEFHP